MKTLFATLFVLSIALTAVKAEDIISTNEEITITKEIAPNEEIVPNEEIIISENEDIITKNIITEVNEAEVADVEISE